MHYWVLCVQREIRKELLAAIELSYLTLLVFDSSDKVEEHNLFLCCLRKSHCSNLACPQETYCSLEFIFSLTRKKSLTDFLFELFCFYLWIVNCIFESKANIFAPENELKPKNAVCWMWSHCGSCPTFISHGSALKWSGFLNRNPFPHHKLKLKCRPVHLQHHIKLWILLSGSYKLENQMLKINLMLSHAAEISSKATPTSFFFALEARRRLVCKLHNLNSQNSYRVSSQWGIIAKT